MDMGGVAAHEHAALLIAFDLAQAHREFGFPDDFPDVAAGGQEVERASRVRYRAEAAAAEGDDEQHRAVRVHQQVRLAVAMGPFHVDVGERPGIGVFVADEAEAKGPSHRRVRPVGADKIVRPVGRIPSAGAKPCRHAAIVLDKVD